MRVSRIWDYLALRRWTGQVHEIDQAFPHRPAGNIVAYCPACIELGVNTTEEEVQSCPHDLRYALGVMDTLSHVASGILLRSSKRPTATIIQIVMRRTLIRVTCHSGIGSSPISPVHTHIGAISTDFQKQER
jgi:hypothetical protein